MSVSSMEKLMSNINMKVTELEANVRLHLGLRDYLTLGCTNVSQEELPLLFRLHENLCTKAQRLQGSKALHHTVSATAHFFSFYLFWMWETLACEGQHDVPPFPHVLHAETKRQ